MYSAAYLATYHLMTHTTCYEKTAKPLVHVYLHCNLCQSGDLLTALSRVELKNTLSGNFQKSEINTYTGNFDMNDTSLYIYTRVILLILLKEEL